MTRDLIIIGAGPAGMAAATEAAAHNLSVTLLDEQRECGGQVYRSIESVAAKRPQDLTILGPDYRHGKKLIDALYAANIDYKPRACVWNIQARDSQVFYSRNGRAYSLSAKRILIATGAMERPCPIPGWTLPGVMGAGAAQIVLKSAGMIPAGAVVLAGCGPLLLLTAAQLHNAGAQVKAVIETTTWHHYLAGATGLLQALFAPEYLLKGLGMRRILQQAKIPLYSNARDIQAIGKAGGGLKAVRLRTGNRIHNLNADTLLLHEGVIPNTALTRQAGLIHEWSSQQQHWQPKVSRDGSTSFGNSSISNIVIAGDGAGILGAKAAELSGRMTALNIARQLGKVSDSDCRRLAHKLKRSYWRQSTVRPLLDKLFAPSISTATTDETIFCRCYEVTQKSAIDHIHAGCDTPDQVKALLRCGMGPCQGRMCSDAMARIIAKIKKLPLEEVGVYKIRPPIKPITLSELASLKTA